MSPKEVFLNSLSDEDLGYFHCYEFNDNLEELLVDKITFKQLKLFQAWKYQEERSAQLHKYPAFLDSPNFDQNKARILKTMIDAGRIGAIESFVIELPQYKPEFTQWKQQYLRKMGNEAIPTPKPSEFPPFLDYLHLSKNEDITFRQLVTNKRWNVLDAWIDQKYPKYSNDYNNWKQAVLAQK